MGTPNSAVETKELDLTGGRMSVLEWQNLLDEMEMVSGHPETFQEKAIRKCKDNPLVPIGASATVGCLTLGLLNLVKGDSKKQQFFMRGRVAAQGFTIVMIATAMLTSAASKSTLLDSSKK